MKEQQEPLSTDKQSNNSTLVRRSPSTKFERFDFYFWEQSIHESQNHLRAAPWMSQAILDGYRIVVCLALLALSFYHIITNKDPTLLYFTNWGIFLTTIVFCLFSAAIIKERFGN